MNPSLNDLDDPTIFIKGFFSTVHNYCSPWTSKEIETAYQRSKGFHDLQTSCLPTEHSLFPDPSAVVDCNICLKSFLSTDLVMLIPVAKVHFKDAQIRKQQQGLAVCKCPSLMSGHHKMCDFAP